MNDDNAFVVMVVLAMVAAIWGIFGSMTHQDLGEQLDAIQTAIAATPEVGR